MYTPAIIIYRDTDGKPTGFRNVLLFKGQPKIVGFFKWKTRELCCVEMQDIVDRAGMPVRIT